MNGLQDLKKGVQTRCLGSKEANKKSYSLEQLIERGEDACEETGPLAYFRRSPLVGVRIHELP